MLPERLIYHGLRKQPTFRDAIRLVSRRNDIQATSAETPYCWNVTIKIWVVLLIGWKSLYPIRRTTQLLVVTCHRYEISALFAQKSFRVETSGDVAKCRLFSEACYLIVTKRKGNFVKFHAQKQFGIRVRVELENCEYLWKFSRYTFCFCYYIRNCHDIKTFLQKKLEAIFQPVLECIILRYFCRISGLPLLIVLISMLIASTQDSGIHGYVHGDL